MTSGSRAARAQTLRPSFLGLAGADVRVTAHATLLPARSAPLVTPRPIALARSLTDRQAEAPVLRRIPTDAPSADAGGTGQAATTPSGGSGQSLASESEDAAQQVTLLLGERQQILDLARAALRDGNEPL